MTSQFTGVLRRASRFAILAGMLAAPLGAQQPQRDFRAGIRTGVGYAGVMPDALLGLGLFHFLGSQPYGVFADVHTTALSGIRKDANYCPPGIAECTRSWVESNRNDQWVGQSEEWLAFNAGMVYALTREFAILLGAGVAREARFQEYVDDQQDEGRLTDSGNYYVDDDEAPSWKPQGSIGMLLRGGRNIAFKLGWESGIGGIGLGLFLRLR